MQVAATMHQMLLEEIEVSQRDIFTQFPAKVTAYDNGFCSAKPIPRFKFVDGDEIEVPVIDKIPVIFPAGGGAISSKPIRAGDTVWLQCSYVSIHEWVVQYKEVFTPTDNDYHPLSEVVAIPCVYPLDKRLGVSNENVSTVFYELDEEDNPTGEILSEITQRPDGSLLIQTVKGHRIEALEDKSLIVETENSRQKIELLSDGNIEVTTGATIKIQNGNEELINLLSEFMDLLGDPSRTHTNTMIGNMPLNSFADIQALKARLDTLKG